MLTLKQITKQYDAGDTRVEALRGVDVSFRQCEFAAILGPSGCGKTTLLNIIGGLDRYTSGDMTIAGRSTKEYRDGDWDAYRNHSIGFVFQSYNLIPHQTVLSNVELALTLSGVGRSERKKRAIEALEKVGLGDQLKKKPNQMSGGQMQRVAIARALVNDPEILLADEPTGALDSETSVQVMEILKTISREKLVIMVTHNPDLAQQYATRIIRLLDGRIVADSDPYTEEEEERSEIGKQKTGMSFSTALGLSRNNLLTKKTRTILTAFAGSIGIIGIALILSLSSGIDAYISRVEQDTLSSYPLMIEKQTVDTTTMLSGMMGVTRGNTVHEDGRVYSGSVMTDMMNTMMSRVTENDLVSFRAFLTGGESGVDNLVTGIEYGYETPLIIYRRTGEGSYIQANPSKVMEEAGMSAMFDSTALAGNSMMQTGLSRMDVFQQLLDNKELLESQYEILTGRLPDRYDEVVIIVNRHNEINDYALYALGLKDRGELKGQMDSIMRGEQIVSEDISFSYEELLALDFRLMINTDFYTFDGTQWQDRKGEAAYAAALAEKAPRLRVVGILRPREDAVTTTVSSGIGYLGTLMEYLVGQVNDSEIVRAQLASPDYDVLTGYPFKGTELTADFIRAQIEKMDSLPEFQKNLALKMSDEQLLKMAQSEMAKSFVPTSGTSAATLEESLKVLGVCDVNSPSYIYIYPKDFESKEQIISIIDAYNDSRAEEQKISYTDYVGVLMSSVTTIIDAISYVLIAFVAISLVVSSIMIGIITYISVLERTKEIGILRAIGASKRDISRVFNAETLIVGFAAGVIGIGMTLLLNQLINLIIHRLTGIHNAAALPAGAGVILVLISMLLTFIAGLIPSGLASRKDPVVALRTE